MKIETIVEINLKLICSNCGRILSHSEYSNGQIIVGVCKNCYNEKYTKCLREIFYTLFYNHDFSNFKRIEAILKKHFT